MKMNVLVIPMDMPLPEQVVQEDMERIIELI